MSSHLTKCHACPGICMVSLLDAVLTTRFAKTTQHDTSKAQRLPRKMTMKTATHLLKTAQKVLRLPHWHVTKDVWLSPSAPTQMTTFADTLPADPQSEPGTLATHSGILIYLWHLNGRSPCGNPWWKTTNVTSHHVSFFAFVLKHRCNVKISLYHHLKVRC